MSRPAPYRHEVDAALADGRHPDLIVFTGAAAHEQAERRRIAYGPGTALVLPTGEQPDAFTWPPVAPLAVISDEGDPTHITALRAAITAACTRTAAGAR